MACLCWTQVSTHTDAINIISTQLQHTIAASCRALTLICLQHAHTVLGLMTVLLCATGDLLQSLYTSIVRGAAIECVRTSTGHAQFANKLYAAMSTTLACTALIHTDIYHAYTTLNAHSAKLLEIRPMYVDSVGAGADPCSPTSKQVPCPNDQPVSSELRMHLEPLLLTHQVSVRFTASCSISFVIMLCFKVVP
jgi:hypothetical protein